MVRVAPVFGGPFSGSRHRQREDRTSAGAVLSRKKAIGFCLMRWNGGLVAENSLFAMIWSRAERGQPSCILKPDKRRIEKRSGAPGFAFTQSK
jgi:hypothetical protein